MQGQRSHRRAQFVRGVGDEALFAFEGGVDPRQQVVDGMDKAADFAGNMRVGQWREVAFVACGELVRKAAHRAQGAVHGDEADHDEQRHEEEQRRDDVPRASVGGLITVGAVLNEGEAVAIRIGVDVHAVTLAAPADVVEAVSRILAEEMAVATKGRDGLDIDVVAVVAVVERQRVVRIDQGGGLAEEAVLLVVRFIQDGVEGGRPGTDGDKDDGDGEGEGETQAEGRGHDYIRWTTGRRRYRYGRRNTMPRRPR